MGKKPTSRTLALYLERILLEYTDANKDMYLRLSDIQQLLRTVYNITVDDGQPRQTLKDMAEIGYLSPGHDNNDRSSCLIPSHRVVIKPAAKKGATTYYAIERDSDSGQIKHLIRLLQNMDKTKGARTTEDLLLRNACEVEREEIRDELAQGSLLATDLPNRIELRKLISRIDILDEAIRQKVKIRFCYTKARKNTPEDLRLYTPYLVSPYDGFYYLFVQATHNGPKDRHKKFDAIRIDRIDGLEKTDIPVDDPDTFDDEVEQARRMCRAGIGRLFSEEIDHVRVLCKNRGKERYLIDAIQDKECYDKGQETNEGYREYQFCASRNAMIPWALKWYDAFEVLEPPRLKKTIEKKIERFMEDSVYFDNSENTEDGTL